MSSMVQAPAALQPAVDLAWAANSKYNEYPVETKTSLFDQIEEACRYISNVAGARTTQAHKLTLMNAIRKVADLGAAVKRNVLGAVDLPGRMEVINDAMGQAFNGKGQERHTNDDPIVLRMAEYLGKNGAAAFCCGQAIKKLDESKRLHPHHAYQEILGALCYLSFCGLYLR